MPAYKTNVIHKLLHEEKENILDCLAGWILTHFKTAKERNDFLDRMRNKRLGPKEIYKKQADDFIEDLKKRIFKVWEYNKT